MKKSTAITIIAALSALLVFSFVPRMVQYFAPVPTDRSSDTATDTSSDTSTDSSSDTSIQSLTELVTNHTYEVEITTNETKLLELQDIITDNDYYLAIAIKKNENEKYIGFKGNEENVYEVLFYTASNKQDLNDYNYIKSEIKQFTYNNEYEINIGTYNIFDYLTITDITEEEPIYTRVEAERYEIQFPHRVNGEFCHGGLYCGQFEIEDFPLISSLISLDDADCIYNETFYLAVYVYPDGLTMNEETLDLIIEQGEYGRYVISETQVADEPVAYILEPIYEYVLVE